MKRGALKLFLVFGTATLCGPVNQTFALESAIELADAQNIKIGNSATDTAALPLSITNISSDTITSSNGCVAGIQLIVEVNVTQPGEYTLRSTITDTSGATVKRQRGDNLKAGAGKLKLTFTSKDLIQHFVVDGPYTFADLDILSVDGKFTQAVNFTKRQTKKLALNSLCRGKS